MLVLGGARSGKTTYAERLLAVEPAVDYVATSGERRTTPIGCNALRNTAPGAPRHGALWRQQISKASLPRPGHPSSSTA